MPARDRSIDPAEIGRFEAMGPDWWDPRGPMRPLHRLNPLRIDWIRDVAGGSLTGLSILDIGCGGGLLAEGLAKLGAKVTAIDPAERNIEIAQRHAAQSGVDIDYRATTAEALASKGDYFDIVCAMEVIEHVVEPAAFTRLIVSLARPGGLIGMATLNRTLRSFALAIVGAEYILRWLPKGTHQWEKFVTPDEIETWLEDGGAAIAERTGVSYAPLLDTWRLSRDMGVNYMVAARRDS